MSIGMEIGIVNAKLFANETFEKRSSTIIQGFDFRSNELFRISSHLLGNGLE